MGRRIAEARRRAGMTQAEVALAASVERTALSKIERGHRRVESRELARLADALGRPLAWFLEPSETRRPHERLEEHRRGIRRIAKEHGATDIRVFGSAATGGWTETSDVDFLVRLEPGRTLFDLARLRSALEDLLGCPVDVVTEAGLRARLRDRVLSEARAV